MRTTSEKRRNLSGKAMVWERIGCLQCRVIISPRRRTSSDSFSLDRSWNEPGRSCLDLNEYPKRNGFWCLVTRDHTSRCADHGVTSESNPRPYGSVSPRCRSVIRPSEWFLGTARKLKSGAPRIRSKFGSIEHCRRARLTSKPKSTYSPVWLIWLTRCGNTE